MRVVNLHDHIATLYGPAFQPALHCKRHPTQSDFRMRLPSIVVQETSEFIEAGNQKLHLLRTRLEAVGLQ